MLRCDQRSQSIGQLYNPFRAVQFSDPFTHIYPASGIAKKLTQLYTLMMFRAKHQSYCAHECTNAEISAPTVPLCSFSQKCLVT